MEGFECICQPQLYSDPVQALLSVGPGAAHEYPAEARDDAPNYDQKQRDDAPDDHGLIAFPGLSPETSSSTRTP